MRRLIEPFLIFAFSIVYYAFQACPTFYFWDSAELTTAVLIGGVPHPPGFPSLLLLAKIWDIILPVNKAYGFNLLSTLFASIGLAFWYSAVRLIIQRTFPEKGSIEKSLLSFISAAALGLSFSYSIQAVRFEVYSLNFACFAILSYLALSFSFEEYKRRYYLIITIVVAALALGGHHLTIALTFPGLLLIIYLSGKLKLNLKYFLYCAGAISIIVLLLYFSIYLFSTSNPILNWGDPSNAKNFIDYFFLKEFSTPLSSLAPGHLADNLAFAVGLFVKQVGVLGAVLALWGMIKFSRQTPRIFISLLIILIPNIFSILYFEDYFYDNYDQQGYLLFSVAIVTLFMALIVGFLSDRLTGLARGTSAINRKVGRILFSIIIGAIVLYLPLKSNIFSADLSRIDAAEEYADLFLENAPGNSLIITSYYNTYFCLLADQALKQAGDSRIITNVYNWEHDWGRKETGEMFDLNSSRISNGTEFYRQLLNQIRDKRPVYVEYDNASARLIKYLRPSGLGYLFSISDTTMVDPYSQIMEIENRSKIALKYHDIDWLRAWVLWFQNRGEFYQSRGDEAAAKRYFEAAERVASNGR